MREAFAQEFARRGGMVAAEYAFSADQAALAKLRQAVGLGVADMVFLALDQASAAQDAALPRQRAGALRHLAHQRRRAASARELNRVRFTDMPWLLQPDHAAVMVYPRAQYGDAVDFDRLYAFGIDAFRIGLELFRQTANPVIDGVTGRIRLDADQQFAREAVVAQFTDGKLGGDRRAALMRERGRHAEDTRGSISATTGPHARRAQLPVAASARST